MLVDNRPGGAGNIGAELAARSAPAGTSKDVIATLNAEVVRVLRLPDTKARLVARGFEPVGGTPEQLADYMKAELAKSGEIVKRAGIKAD